MVIRSASGLSSLAISDHEPSDPNDGPEYDESLRSERDTLRQALLRGATYRVLLNPPRRFAKSKLPDRLMARFRRLIGLFESKSDIENPDAAKEDLEAMKHCEWAVNPIASTNLLIIGDNVAYEGIKRGGTRGFERTHCETNPDAIEKLIEDFDAHFADCIETQQQDVGSQLKSFYEEAMKLDSQ